MSLFRRIRSIGLHSENVASLLAETRATDPITFAGITAAFIFIVVMTTWFLARRAAFIDPTRALRSE